MILNTELIYNSIPKILSAASISLKITFFSMIIGIIGGIILALLGQSKYFLIRLPSNIYVLIIRGTPMLIQITFIYYFLPLLGINISSIATAIIAIGMNSSAYVSQIIKTGILAVSKDQLDSAYVLGLKKTQIIRHIILPQAIRYSLPSLVNEMTTLVKDSSLASIIGVVEIYKEAKTIINQSYDVISIFALVALIYLIITSLLTFIAYLIQEGIKENA
jgi:His/Glu/Gln/Arg/opine family amino acid ABC transporter permease subunit